MMRIKSGRLGFAVLMLGLAIWLGHAQSAEYFACPENYRHYLRKLAPADVLTLAAGDYRHGLPLHHLQGKPRAPIVIRGSAGHRTVFHARPGHNTISLVNVAYLEIRRLRLEGHGIPVDGVKLEGHADWGHHITLADLLLQGFDAHQQTVAISTKSPAWGWEIRDNRIDGAGTGLYLGNSNGRDPFFASLIAGNAIHNTIGYNLQIKHQVNRPANLPDAPTHSATTIIRHNTFSKANGGSRKHARPTVLVGHWPGSGRGANDSYRIYANLFYRNPTEALFQGEGNIALYNNLFVKHTANDFPAIAIQPHHDVPKRIAIFYNTIVSRGQGIRVLDGAPDTEQRVTGNAVFATKPLVGGTQGTNYVAAYDQSISVLGAPMEGIAALDLRPRHGRLMAQAPIEIDLQHYPEAELDYFGHTRHQSTFGAIIHR